MIMKNLNSKLKPTFEVVGIGNAIVDVVAKVDESFLEKRNLTKGSMTLINDDQSIELYKSIKVEKESSGGSAANTLAGIAQLGANVGFIGRVKDDNLGKTFTEDLRSSGANFQTPPQINGASTARCMIFVTPDAQRTMCTFLGTSVDLEPKDLDLSMVANTSVLYLEGYLWDNISAKDAFITASKLCKNSGGKVALSLSDSFCVKRHQESFIDLVENHVDILFANEDEIKSLYTRKDFNEILVYLQKKCKVSAITLGESGSIIITEKETFNIKSYKFGPTIDTTGAGDLYAGGFLYGYTTGKSISHCGHIGSICAGHIVTQLGSRSNISLKQLINENITD
mgnify:CR=1 FL=1|tara:strand:- start:1691 stop:2710 length:1020 start_codon:yes stop_codon:yes gene_type:complete